MKTNTTDATSVHIKGQVAGTVKLDLSMTSDGRASGTVDGGTGPLTVLRTGGKDYIQITDAFIAQQNMSASVANLVRGKYFLASGSDATSIDQFLDMKSLMAQANSDTKTYTMGSSTQQVDGQSAYVLTATDGSTVYVAATGKALPLRLTGSPSSPGQLDFTQWNEDLPIPPAPPADQIIDLSQLPKS